MKRCGSGLAALLFLLAAPALADIRQVGLPANDLVYSPFNGKIYASVPSSGGQIGNSVTTLDPITGVAGPSIWVGSEPGKMALSDDGRFLYVALQGAGAVRRVDLAAQQAELQFSLGNSTYDGPNYVADMRLLPGQPHALAISRTSAGFGLTGEGIAIYDDGVARSQATPPNDFPLEIAFSASATRLYASNGHFSRLNVDAMGVSVLDTVFFPFGGDLQFDHGLLYGAGGGVLDPEAKHLVGSYTVSNATAVALAPGRVFFLSEPLQPSGEARWNLQAFDRDTFLPLWSLPIPSTAQHVGSLIVWGQERGEIGVAFRTDQGQVFLVRPDMAPCNPLSADLILSQAAVPSPAPAGATVELTLFVANSGPDPASGVTLVDDLPAGATLLSASSSQGRCTSEAGRVTCEIGVLGKAAGAQLTLRIQPGAAGTLSNNAGVIANEPDPFPGDNAGVLRAAVLSASGGTAASPETGPLSEGESQPLPFPTNDLVYSKLTGKLYGSLPAAAGPLGNQVVAIDPATGALGPSFPMGSEPGRLGLSDDGRYLYVGLDSLSAVRRLDLQTGTTEFQFSLGSDAVYGSYIAEALEVLPGHPDTVAISRQLPSAYRASLAIYDRGVMRPDTALSRAPGNRLHFADDGSLLYGISLQEPSLGWYRAAVDASGLTLRDSSRQFFGNNYIALEFGDGRLYTSAGQTFDLQLQELAGQYGFGGSAILPDPASGRVFFLSSLPPEPGVWLLTEDMKSFLSLGAIPLPGVTGERGRMLRWGTDGLAIRLESGETFRLRAPVVTAPDLKLTFQPPDAQGGEAVTGLITLTAPEPVSGAGVSLTSSNPALATLPARVPIPLGATEVAFPIATHALSTPGSVVLTASSGGITRSAPLILQAADLCSLSLAPAAILGGASGAGAVTLAEPAPRGGLAIALSSDDPAAAGVPPSVVVPEAAASAMFPIATHAVMQDTAVGLSARAAGVTLRSTLEVLSLRLSSLRIDPNILAGGQVATGTVTLTGPAPTGGVVVILTSEHPEFAAVPQSLTVPPGATSAPFPITTHAVTAGTAIRITASAVGVSQSAPLVLLPGTGGAVP
jgi:uncharacterized repeat protein (TIGR01451 family)